MFTSTHRGVCCCDIVTVEAMNIDVEIEGVSDRAVVRAIRTRVRMLARHIEGPEDWRVRLCPSASRAEWDLGIRTRAGWYIAWFDAPVQRLADVVEQHLQEQVAAQPPQLRPQQAR